MEKKAKILFVITKSNFGGAQKYVYDIATNLPKDRFDVAVALGGSGTLVQKLEEQNIRVIPIPALIRDINVLSDFKSFIQLFTILRKEKPDIVHLNSAKASGVGAFIARITGVPNIIFTAHGWAFNEERPWCVRLIIKFFSWLTVLLAHKTIAVSEAVHRDTENWPLVQGKVITIHNGTSTPDFLTKEHAKKELLNETSIPSDALIIGTNAELHKNKGLTYAIEAMKQLNSVHKDIYYVIIGDGEEKNKLHNLIKSLDLKKNVFLLGFIPEAARFLQAFDIFLLSSTKEGLPYVLLESGLAEIPVVATDVGGIPEVIEDGKTGILVPARDIDAISKALALLIDSPALRTKLGQGLNEKVLAEFSQKTMLEKTISLYEAR